MAGEVTLLRGSWATKLIAFGSVVLITAAMSSATRSGLSAVKKPVHKHRQQVSTSHPGVAKPAFSDRSSRRSKRSRKIAGNWRRGQQKIDSRRARQIQEALAREHYLSGTPSGVWDDATQQAMQKFQADHGWQSKVTPDSRALIKLGLGPDYSEKNLMLFVPKPAADPVAASGTTPATPSKQP